jgi:uncharacterized protein (DUF58 family)
MGTSAPRSSSSLRVTKVGLWYVLLTAVVGIAATNTGNNALYMVVAAMTSLLVASWFLAWRNLQRLDVELLVPEEIYANAPCVVGFRALNRRRAGDARLVVLQIDDGRPVLLERLPAVGLARSQVETGGTRMLFSRRGRRDECLVRFTSLFPAGLFRSSLTCPTAVAIVVYPELFSAASLELDQASDAGHVGAHRAGWGYDLFSLRAFRGGDDPRSIHWKRSARTGSLVFVEREAEETRRFSVVLDNALDVGSEGSLDERFELLVSEAATASVDYLERGYEVELVSRDGVVPFAGGQGQRWKILEALALIEPMLVERGPLRPLRGTAGSPQLRLGVDRARERIAG